jgi:predicted transcriptional regulator
MKTREMLDLNDDKSEVVMAIKRLMDKPYSTWTQSEKEAMSWLRIPVLTIIEVSSGGHPSITNIQGLNYMSSRKDLLQMLFKTENYTDVMKMIADEFIKNLKSKIDEVKIGKDIEYTKSDVELMGSVANENFSYYLKSNSGDVKPVTKEEFIKAGFDSKFEPKKPNNGNKGFSLDISDNKIIGKFD